MVSEAQFTVLETLKSISDELLENPKSKFWRQRYGEESEVLKQLKETEGKRGDVFCNTCEHRVSSGTAQPIELSKCNAPISNWYSHNTPRQTMCCDENSNNNCRNFKLKKRE